MSADPPVSRRPVSRRPVSRRSVERLLRPKSVAVIGVSADPGSMGGRSLASFGAFGYGGDIHLVSRTSTEVHGRATVPTIDDLPEGIDAAIVALPQKAVVEAVEACGRRGIGGLVVYAAGFAEAGDAGRAEQDRMAAIARAVDMAVLGPNTLGFTNYVDGIALAFGPNAPYPPAGRPALAVIAQSGAMMASMRLSARERGLAVSYAVATGNEAVTGVEDYLDILIDDADTRCIAVFAEQLRRPLRFLELARRAREANKPIVLLHPGSSERGRASAASHTGALSSDYATMSALVGHEAVVMVETLEEFLDAAEVLTRYSSPPLAGPAIITDSGAFRGLSLDQADAIGLPLPDLTPATEAALAERLPAFASRSNPLDITAQGLKDMPLYTEATRILLEDEACGGAIVALMPGTPEVSIVKAAAVVPKLARTSKPVAYVVMGGATPIDPSVERQALDAGVPFFRSPERALRAFGHLQRYAALKAGAQTHRTALRSPAAQALGPGVLPEYAGKALLAQAGVRVPPGALATSPDEACAAAERIGWPVVVKVQSADLPHKTEVGGVMVGVRDAAALRAAWDELHARVARHRPGLALDGLLVEAMGPPGVEMVVGGRRDPDWGPVVLVGLGGVWIEVLKDVRLLPPDLGRAGIVAELGRLKAHALLDGARGAAPVDLDALADVVERIGGLLLQHPQITEIDVNPLIAYPQGQAPLALDALIVVGARE